MRLPALATVLGLAAPLALAFGLAACGGFASDGAGSSAPYSDTTSGDAFSNSSWTDPSTQYGAADTTMASDTWSPPTYADAASADTASADTAGGPLPAADTTGGDKFEAPGTNPFVVAGHDPFSTFGADVDTASYELFKRYVQQYGQLPVPASVRLEEFVNYFHYDYPAPAWDAERPFNVAVEAAPSAFSDTTLLRVGVQGKVVPPDLKAPANLVFLVDVSGSMASSDKLDLVKVLLRETLNVLAPDDTVAIVTYSTTIRVVLGPTAVAHKALINEQIAALEAGGSTAGQAGLALAYQVAEQGRIEGGVNHVLLCTDGDFNVGPSSTSEMVDFITAKRLTGITLTVVGFGTGNLNDAMMEAVSNAGDGVYAYIGDADSAVAYANTRMLGSIYFIAKDLKIQLAFNPAVVYAYRLLGYENNAIADVQFVDDTVDAGEVGSGHAVTALYELVLTGDAVPAVAGAPALEDGITYDGVDLPTFGPEDVVEVRIRYKRPGASVEDPALPVDYMVDAHRIFDTFAETSADFQWASAVAAFAEILKGSPYARSANLAEIGSVVAAQADRDVDRSEFVGLFTAARTLLAAASGAGQ